MGRPLARETVAALDEVIEDLVAANRILAAQGVVDGFGHVSARHPENPQHYLLSRARPPECIEAADIMEFTLAGEAIDARGRRPYNERFIHGALYEARPDLHAVVHSHSPSVIPFGIVGETLRPVLHMAATIGARVPIWEPRDRFGDTDMLVSDMAQGRDLARAVGTGKSALMRGHGSVVAGRSVREAVYVAVYLEVNAHLQLDALRFGKPVNFLSPGEIDKILARQAKGRPAEGFDRAWEGWCNRASVPFKRRG
ncbi:MAG: class II aldolase/adducin family protein [Alphaproteobacteria bacterium]|nr:class II aldolase/adducin family protein [Alphaproteobacteria bacterium]